MSVEGRRRERAAVAEPTAREFLRKADPVLARVIDAHLDFHSRAWIDELPGLDSFGMLIFQVAGASAGAIWPVTPKDCSEQSGVLPSV
jgi:hypothetical protein